MGNPPPSFLFFAYGLLIWTTVWKGLALWRAAHYRQRNWFLVILLLNPPILTTLGLVEIVYLFKYAKKPMTLGEIKEWFTKTFSGKA